MLNFTLIYLCFLLHAIMLPGVSVNLVTTSAMLCFRKIQATLEILCCLYCCGCFIGHVTTCAHEQINTADNVDCE